MTKSYDARLFLSRNEDIHEGQRKQVGRTLSNILVSRPSESLIEAPKKASSSGFPGIVWILKESFWQKEKKAPSQTAQKLIDFFANLILEALEERHLDKQTIFVCSEGCCGVCQGLPQHQLHQRNVEPYSVQFSPTDVTVNDLIQEAFITGNCCSYIGEKQVAHTNQTYWVRYQWVDEEELDITLFEVALPQHQKTWEALGANKMAKRILQ
jgi:hypothetical protein